MEYNLADLFESVVDTVPDREALVANGVRLTYRQLDERSNRLAHHLADAGIGHGDHVGCHMRNRVEYVETMLAAYKIRAVPVNVNFRYVEEELRYLYDNADLAAVVFGAEFADRVAAVAPSIDTLRHLVVVGDTDGSTATTLPQAVRYEDAVADASAAREFPPRSGDDLRILYTGGTTGMPKGVMWRQEDLFFAGMGGGNPVGTPVDSPEELAGRIDPDGFQLTMFCAPPLMHGAAELGTFIGFWSGYRIVLIDRYTGHGALALVEKEQINTINLVGDAMAIPLIEALEDGEYDTSSLIVISTAGAILSRTVRQRLSELLPNVSILDSFGSSETGYNGSEAENSSPDEGLKFRMTARTAVISDDLRVIQPGSEEIGRVAQRGHIPQGYYGDEEKTAATFPVIDGERWVLMGDAARVDADGVIHVLGRGSVCINSGGEKIFPEEVEAALKSHPAVIDAVVAGIPDERWGQRVAAVVQVRRGNDAPTQGDIEAHLDGRIARFKCPRRIMIVEEIVRSPAGKPDYKWARAQLDAEAEAGATQPA